MDYVSVHSTNPDTQIQVRGRVNCDLRTLYLPVEGNPEIVVPAEYLGKRLFRAEKQAMIEALNLRNPNNRLFGWQTVRSLLLDNDYLITDGREKNKRFVIIEPADNA